MISSKTCGAGKMIYIKSSYDENLYFHVSKQSLVDFIHRGKIIRDNKQKIISRAKIAWFMSKLFIQMTPITIKQIQNLRYFCPSENGDCVMTPTQSEAYFNFDFGVCSNLTLYSQTNTLASLLNCIAMEHTDGKNASYPVGGADEYVKENESKRLWFNEKRWDYLDKVIEISETILNGKYES